MKTIFLRRLVLLSVFLAPATGFSVGQNFGKLPSMSACPNDINPYDDKLSIIARSVRTQPSQPKVEPVVRGNGSGKNSETVL